MRLPLCSATPTVLELTLITQVLDGHIEPLNVVKDVHFQPGSRLDEEDPCDRLYVALLVRGEDDELIDALGLSWSLPSLIYDTPMRSEIWAKYCVDVAKSILVNGKPRHAIRDATLLLEATCPMLGRLGRCSVDALCY